MRRKRMVDRSHCKRCASLGIITVLTPENTYKRNDTYNKLHCYCKECYLIIQKERTSALNKNGKKYTALVKNGVKYRSRRIYFDSLDEKRSFLNGRKSANKCFRSNDTNSGLPIGASARDGDPEKCDECNGILRYDERGFLCCDDCGLISDITPFYRDSCMTMLKGKHAWNGEDADEQCIDSYYSMAYSK